jgi:hypothetical protein
MPAGNVEEQKEQQRHAHQVAALAINEDGEDG